MEKSEQIITELRKTNRLLAAIAVKGMPQKEKVLFLRNAEYIPKEIAEMCGMSWEAVRKILSRAKK